MDDDEYAPVANAKDLRNQSKSLNTKSHEYSDPSFTEKILNMYSDMQSSSIRRKERFDSQLDISSISHHKDSSPFADLWLPADGVGKTVQEINLRNGKAEHDLRVHRTVNFSKDENLCSKHIRNPNEHLVPTQQLSKRFHEQTLKLSKHCLRSQSTKRKNIQTSTNDYVLKRERLKDVEIVSQIDDKFILGTIVSTYKNPIDQKPKLERVIVAID